MLPPNPVRLIELLLCRKPQPLEAWLRSYDALNGHPYRTFWHNHAEHWVAHNWPGFCGLSYLATVAIDENSMDTETQDAAYRFWRRMRQHVG